MRSRARAAARWGWGLVQKECARVQFFDALRLHWARAQRCYAVAVSAAISAGLLACSKLASALKTCFLLAAVVNAFSVRRILRAFHRRGEETESELNFLLSLQRLAKSRSRAQIARLAGASIINRRRFCCETNNSFRSACCCIGGSRAALGWLQAGQPGTAA